VQSDDNDDTQDGRSTTAPGPGAATSGRPPRPRCPTTVPRADDPEAEQEEQAWISSARLGGVSADGLRLHLGRYEQGRQCRRGSVRAHKFRFVAPFWFLAFCVAFVPLCGHTQASAASQLTSVSGLEEVVLRLRLSWILGRGSSLALCFEWFGVLVTGRWCSRYTDSGRCERLVRATKWACGSDLPRWSCTDGRCCTTSGALAPTNCSLPSSALGWDLGKVPQTRKQQRPGRSCSSESQNAGPNGSGRLTSHHLVRVPGKKKGTLTETPLGHHLSLCPLSSLSLRVRSWSRPRPQTDTDRLRKHPQGGLRCDNLALCLAHRQSFDASEPGLVHDTVPHCTCQSGNSSTFILVSHVRSSAAASTTITRRSLARTCPWEPWAKGARTLPSSLGWAEKQLAMTSCSAWATAPQSESGWQYRATKTKGPCDARVATLRPASDHSGSSTMAMQPKSDHGGHRNFHRSPGAVPPLRPPSPLLSAPSIRTLKALR
jgi:hypothetical protein